MTTIPTSSPAVLTRGGTLDDPDLFIDGQIPIPVLGEHDLLVHVQAVSVNPVDIKVRKAYASATEPDRILGWDASGVVVAVGSAVSAFAPGDEVYYAGSVDRSGSNAAYHAVHEDSVAHKPRSLSFAEAAALPLTAITAWESLFDKLGLSSHSEGTIVVIGAAGGVGSILIQLVKTMTQLRVIALASREESQQWVMSLGADEVLDYKDPHLKEQIAELAPGGVDYVFTGQTPDKVSFIVDILRPFGEIVAIDEDKNVDIMSLKSKALSWHWEYMFARPIHGWERKKQQALLEELADRVDKGEIRSTLRTLLSPINAETVRRAHNTIEQGHTLGKIVLEGWDE